MLALKEIEILKKSFRLKSYLSLTIIFLILYAIPEQWQVDSIFFLLSAVCFFMAIIVRLLRSRIQEVTAKSLRHIQLISFIEKRTTMSRRRAAISAATLGGGLGGLLAGPFISILYLRHNLDILICSYYLDCPRFYWIVLCSILSGVLLGLSISIFLYSTCARQVQRAVSDQELSSFSFRIERFCLRFLAV